MELGKVKSERPSSLAGQGIEDPLFPDPDKILVIEDEVHRLRGRKLVKFYERNNPVHASGPVLLPGFDVHPVYQRVCERCRQVLQGLFGKSPADKVELRGVDRFPCFKLPFCKVFNGLTCGCTYVIGNARQETDFNGTIKVCLRRFVHREFLYHWVTQLERNLPEFFRSEIPGIRGYCIYIYDMEFFNGKPERSDPIGSDGKAGVGLITDFYPVDICHVYLILSWSFVRKIGIKPEE